jgi:WD40 repeat protein
MVASRAGPANQAKLDKWSLPTLRRQPGFDGLSPFRKLALSPDGEYLAGIWSGIERWRPEPARFELRFAASGGLDHRYPPTGGRPSDAPGFVTFAHDGGLCVFGWEAEFHVLDISTGTSRYLRRVEAPFADAAFTGSGRLFATAEETGLLRMWDPATWQPVREYDWGCGPLSCVAFNADGTAGVCGTAEGQLVLFDVDE